MKFDRNNLNDIQFIQPQVKGLQFVLTPYAIMQSIGDPAAYTIYSILRSKPPIHRWNTGRVVKEVRDLGMKIGRKKIESIMSFLNKSGWILYVDLIMPDGKKRGCIVEVMYEQLPRNLRSKRRKIRVQNDGTFKVYENDNTEVAPSDYRPTTKVVDPIYSDQVNEDEHPLPPIPQERSPVERERGDEYKKNLVLKSPYPFYEKGGKFDFSGWKNSENAATTVSSPLGNDHPGSVKPAPGDACSYDPEESPCAIPGVDVNTSTGRVNKLSQFIDQLPRLAKEVEDDHGQKRADYESLIMDLIVPRLQDPPCKPRWSRNDRLEWCETSVKSKVFLLFAMEDAWTSDLARMFGRNPGRYSLADITIVLLAGKWHRYPPKPLSNLLDTTKGGKKNGEQSGPEPLWASYVEAANNVLRDNIRPHLKYQLNAYNPSGDDEKIWAEATQRHTDIITANRRSAHDGCSPDEKFDWLLATFFLHRLQQPDTKEVEWLETNKVKWLPEMTELIASSRMPLLIAANHNIKADKIWGISWEEIRSLHIETASILNKRADTHGFNKGVVPSLELFDEEVVLSTIDQYTPAISWKSSSDQPPLDLGVPSVIQ